MSVPSQQAGAYARVAMVQKVADQLRQVLVPDLQQLVGDPQTHLVTLNLVQRYLQQNQLIFDEQTLRSMFAEADFRKESGLSSGSLAAALQGRFPKRKYGQKDWLALASLLLRRPVPELQSLLAPPSKRQAIQGAQSMDTSQGAAARLSAATSSKKSPFVTRPITGEWGSLIRAASQCQAFTTGSRPGSMMSSRSAALQSTAPAALKAPAALAAMQRLSSAPATPASAARFTPCPSSPDAAMQLSDAHTLVHTTTVQFQDDMGTTAMSIDTPSYAHSLGLGQPGLQSQFASNAGGLVQDLVQSMSIDEDVGMQPWGTYKPGATFASHNKMSATMGASDYGGPTMMMTTHGPKCLDQTLVEEGINEDIRQGCASFASQQQYQHHAAGLQIMSDMTADANAGRKKRPMLKVRH